MTVPGSGFGQEEGTFHLRTTILPPEEKIGEFVKLFQVGCGLCQAGRSGGWVGWTGAAACDGRTGGSVAPCRGLLRTPCSCAPPMSTPAALACCRTSTRASWPSMRKL